MQTGCVISDLHLLARRSVAEQKYMQMIHAALKNAKFCILNGDIFDFRWSTKPTLDESVGCALQWLKLLINQYSGCKFYYIIGNHDCFAPFVNQLRILTSRSSNLEWHSTHIIIGDSLFIHGDLHLKRQNNREPIIRHFHDTVGRNGPILERIYEFVVSLRIHYLIAALLHQPRGCAKHIIRALNDNTPTVSTTLDIPLDEINNIYFGHTHYAFSDYKYKGITFTNTGSAIRGLKFNMQVINIIEDNHA